MDIKDWQQRLADFATERDWEQFHTPKNLASALVVESAELLEQFQWLTAQQSAPEELEDKSMDAIQQEIADVTIYLLRLCDVLGVDLEMAMEEKLKVNAQKYPVGLARGNATKYTNR